MVNLVRAGSKDCRTRNNGEEYKCTNEWEEECNRHNSFRNANPSVSLLAPTRVDRQSHPFFRSERMASNWRRRSLTASSGDNRLLG